jgi:predicted neutral ceramidase superfamily lipid hydrolase
MNKSNFDIDLSKSLSIKDNLKKSIIVTSGSSIIAAIFFLIAWILTDSVWFISMFFILIITGISFYIVIKKVERKIVNNYDENNNKGIEH